MIDVQVRGVEAFQANLDAFIETGLDAYLGYRFEGWSRRVFEDLVMGTPQWSGDTAANWRYSIGMPDGTYQPIIAKALLWPIKQGAPVEPRHRGDMAAVWAATSRAQDGPSPRWTDRIFFTNNTPIAEDLETNSVYIRPANLVGGAVAMVSYIVNKWKNLPV